MLNKIITICLFLFANCFKVYSDSFYDRINLEGNIPSGTEKVGGIKNSNTDSLESMQKNPFKDRLSIFVKGGIKLDDFHDYEIRYGQYWGLQLNGLIDSSWGLQHEFDYWKSTYKRDDKSGNVYSYGYIISLLSILNTINFIQEYL